MIRISIYLFLSLFLLSCSNQQQSLIDWGHNIKIGSTLEEVLNLKPDNISINTQNPIQLDSIKRYYVWIEPRPKDILAMDYCIEFENNRFRGFFGRK